MSYQANAASADKILNKFGMLATHTIVAGGAYSVSTGTRAATETTQVVKLVVFDYGEREIDGTMIVAGDKQVLIAAKGITAPSVDDKLSINGVTWTIKSVTELKPTNIAILYDCKIRK